MAERRFEYKVVEKLNKKGDVIKRKEYHNVTEKDGKDGPKRGGKQTLAIEGPDQTKEHKSSRKNEINWSILAPQIRSHQD